MKSNRIECQLAVSMIFFSMSCRKQRERERETFAVDSWEVLGYMNLIDLYNHFLAGRVLYV